MKETLITKNKINVIAVVGPTASGKTAYSIDLAKKVDGEIISADSRLVYKDMNIGTAKPTQKEMSGIKHYMIDIVYPDEDYSAGLYKKQASEYINKIHLKGKIPIIVGGTGLYVDMLLRGYNPPQTPPNAKFRKQLELLNCNELWEKLKKIDNESAFKIEKNDKKKLIRALEIISSTSQNLEDSRGMGESEYKVKWIGRNFERNELYERINARVDNMLSDGLIDETKLLIKKYGRAYNIVNTIGYREVLQYIDGNMSLDCAVELLKKSTRNYAKRQLTWFRKFEDIEWNVYPDKLMK